MAEVSRGLGEAMAGHRDVAAAATARSCRRGVVIGGRSGSSPSRATSRPMPRRSGAWPAPRHEVRRVRELDGPRGPRDPRRREHDAAQPDGRRALARGAAGLPRGGRGRGRHLRGRHPARPRGASAPAEPRPPRRRDRAERLRAAGRVLRGGVEAPERSGRRCEASSSARRASGSSGPAWRCSLGSTASRCSCDRDGCWRRRSIRS